MQRDGLIDKWFFVRYSDPLPHLRFRFHGNKKDFWIMLLKEINLLLADKLADGIVENLVTDCYHRELERYNAPYEQIESFFYIDSMAVASCFTGLSIEPDHRWMLALLGTDKLLDDLGIACKDKLALISRLHAHMTLEFDPHQKMRPSMDLHYRRHTKHILQMLDAGLLHTEPKVSDVFTQRSENVAKLFASDSAKKAEFRINATDLVHMFLNRWFYASQREQEFSVYHYLKKYYTTAMKNKKSNQNIPKSSGK
jgi:thiopeptide-type bacteriocin biosynthesis protein